MNVSSLLDELDEMIDSAWNMPLSGGKALVDAERVREIVDKIRSSLPQEIRQARRREAGSGNRGEGSRGAGPGDGEPG